MKEIIELSKRIQNQAPNAVPKATGYIQVDRQRSSPADLAALPLIIRMELENLLAKLDAVIPNDFEYCIFLGDDHPALMMGYVDGAQTLANCPFDWDPQRSIIDQLQIVNWENQRAGVLERCQAFDHLNEEAKHRPANLPSTLELQERFLTKLQAFVKRNQTDDGKVHLLMYREDDGVKTESRFREESFDTLKQIPGELEDIMVVRYWVIAIVAEGKLLPVAEIDALKNLALQDMKEHMPTSYAKATGRWDSGGILNFMGTGTERFRQ